RTEAAAALIKNYLEKQDADPNWAANLYEQIGQLAEAEKLHRRLLAESTGFKRLGSFIDFLRRQGRTQEALDLCEQLWKTAPVPEIAGDASLAVIRGAKNPTDEQFQRVSRALESALEKKPKSVSLLMSLAELRITQKK